MWLLTSATWGCPVASSSVSYLVTQVSQWAGVIQMSCTSQKTSGLSTGMKHLFNDVEQGWSTSVQGHVRSYSELCCSYDRSWVLHVLVLQCHWDRQPKVVILKWLCGNHHAIITANVSNCQNIFENFCYWFKRVCPVRSKSWERFVGCDIGLGMSGVLDLCTAAAQRILLEKLLLTWALCSCIAN